MSSVKCFLHPGLNNSGPEHWQTHWERMYGFTRIQQADWDAPVASEWIAQIEATLRHEDLSRVVLIGHSLACSTIVRWAEQYGHRIKGALLVAPSDTEAPSYPPGTNGFTPMPVFRLPFPSMVVASSDDFYVRMDRASYFAERWGSEMVTVGALGHINAASNIGEWPEGYALLQSLLKD